MSRDSKTIQSLNNILDDISSDISSSQDDIDQVNSVIGSIDFINNPKMKYALTRFYKTVNSVKILKRLNIPLYVDYNINIAMYAPIQNMDVVKYAIESGQIPSYFIEFASGRKYPEYDVLNLILTIMGKDVTNMMLNARKDMFDKIILLFPNMDADRLVADIISKNQYIINNKILSPYGDINRENAINKLIWLAQNGADLRLYDKIIDKVYQQFPLELVRKIASVIPEVPSVVYRYIVSSEKPKYSPLRGKRYNHDVEFEFE